MTHMRIRLPAAAPTVVNAALVVGDSTTLTAGDTLLQTMLGVHGLTVTVFDDGAAEDAVTTWAVVVLAPSCTSALASKWKTVAAPILTMVGGLNWNNLGLITSTTTTTVASASVKMTDTFYSVAGFWPHASTNSTSSSVSNTLRYFATANLIAGGIKYAEPSTLTTNTFAARFEKGCQLSGGGVAAGRRVILGLRDEALIAGLTTWGSEFVDAALRWLLYRTTTMVRPAAPTVVYSSGTSSDRYINSSTGSDSYDGTSPTFTSGTTGPWLTIGHAVSTASSGATLNLLGTFREGVVSASKVFTFQNYNGGAATWLGNTDYRGSSWTNPATGQWYVAFDPTAQAGLTTEDMSTTYSNSDNPELNTTSADYHLGVQIDGEPLIMRTAANQLDEKSGWYDSTNKRVYIGKDPTTCTTIEITTQDRALYLNTNLAAASKVRGILFSGFHTHANSDALGGALVVSSNNVTVENVIFHAGTGTGWTAYNNGLVTSNVWSFASGAKGFNANNVDGWTHTGYIKDTWSNRRRFSNSSGVLAGLAGMKITNTQSINNGGSIIAYRAYGMLGLWFDLSCTGTHAQVDCRENGRGPQGTGGGFWFEDGTTFDVGDVVCAYNYGYGGRTGESGLIRFWNGVFINNTGSQFDFYNGQNSTSSRHTATAEFHNAVFAVTDPNIAPTTALFRMRSNRSSPPPENSATMLPSNIGRCAFVRSTASQPTNIITWLNADGTSTSYASKTAFDTGHAGVLEASSVDLNVAGSTLFTSDNHGGTTYEDPHGDYRTLGGASIQNAGEVVPDSTIAALLGKSVSDTLDIGTVAIGAYQG